MRAFVLFVLPAIGFLIVMLMPAERPVARDPVEAATAYLLSKQARDGAWHSSILRARPDVTESPALTALVLAALPPSHVTDRGPIERGLAYLLSNMAEDGCVGWAREPADLPNYTTALTILALLKWKPPEWETYMRRAGTYLVEAQLDEGEGWAENDVQYGGWDFGRPQPRLWNREDISVTSYVLEALEQILHPANDTFRKARVYVQRCQNPDGGFNFRPDLSKAATNDEPFRSYGSVTADGLRSLRICEGDTASAEAWLKLHRTVEKNPGFPTPAHTDFDRAIFYYYLRSLSVAAAGPDIRAKLAALQRPDGSFVNDYPAMKEHEPILATALALWAMR